jgi:hypothetical protein
LLVTKLSVEVLPVQSVFAVGLSGFSGASGFGTEPETPTIKEKLDLEDFFMR